MLIVSQEAVCLEEKVTGYYIDGHCHWSLYPVQEAFFQASNRAGVQGFFLGGYDPSDWLRQLELARSMPEQQWFHSFGLHPWWIIEKGEEDCQGGFQLLDSQALKANAIGECGLDFSRRFPKSTHARQETYFIHQIRLARSLEKPLVLHLVSAHGKATEILSEEMGLGTTTQECPGIVHAFTGTRAQASFFLDRGWLLSVGAGALKTGYRKLKNTLPFIPLDRLVLETDSASKGIKMPVKPTYTNFYSLQEIAEGVSSHRPESALELLQASTRNLKRMLSNTLQ